MPSPEKPPSARPELHLLHAADSPRARRDELLHAAEARRAQRKGGPGAGGGDRKGRGNPRRLEHPLFRKTESLQDSCCGHTTNLKASLPLEACLSSPHSPPQSSSWCLDLRLSRQGARGTAAPPASRPGLCGRRLRAPLGPPAAPPGQRLSGARAGAPGSRLARPQPASPCCLPEKTPG